MPTPLNSLTLGQTLGGFSLVLSPQATLGFDRAGRPTGLYENGHYVARGLDGRCLEKKWVWTNGREEAQRHIRVLNSDEQAALRERFKHLLDTARLAFQEGTTLQVYDRGETQPIDPHHFLKTLDFFETFFATDWDDAPQRFARVWKPIGILPPDQYLSLVIQVTEGCAWNRCAFCDFYADQPFRVRSRQEIDRHVDDAVAFFGPALSGRCSIFLGNANAFQAPPERLIPLTETLAKRFPDLARPQSDGVGGIYAFAEAVRLAAWSVDELRAMAAAGFRRVYIGVETGADGLRRLLKKPGSSRDVLNAIHKLKSAGINVGLIVLLGAGGREHAEEHASATAGLLVDSPLGPGDFLYFSPLVDPAPSPFTPLPDSEMFAQRVEIEKYVPPRGERRALYNIHEFLY